MSGVGTRLILIVGLQKSGTSLLSRMLQQSEHVESPFQGEGLDFWGDVPPFHPREYPTGAIYNGHGGVSGHEASASDATPEVTATLQERFAELEGKASIFVNKNPYNTVRLPWLRAIFPESTIVGVVRRPVANVYSLLKRYQPNAESGLPPEDGWWGVKPWGWKELVAEDKVVQCARQWEAVNETMWRDRGLVDLIVRYHELCERPTETIGKILGVGELGVGYPPINCFDDEYTTGSRLRSKNRYYRETGTFETPDTEPIEFPPLMERDVARIEEVCRDVAQRLELDV